MSSRRRWSSAKALMEYPQTWKGVALAAAGMVMGVVALALWGGPRFAILYGVFVALFCLPALVRVRLGRPPRRGSAWPSATPPPPGRLD